MVVFSNVAKVPPHVVWKTCLTPMKWESWDPDVQELLQVSGPCETGTKLTFHMKDGAKLPATLTKVVQNESMSYTARLLGGTLVIQSTIALEQISAEQTRITYAFGLSGFLGGLTGALKSKMITDGTKKGLQNMIRLSEEAAAAAKGGSCAAASDNK